MADVPDRIAELVEAFERNIEAYKNQQYNETQLRREFIDPFSTEEEIRIVEETEK